MINFAGAEKHLRHATLFLGHLEWASKERALEPTRDSEHLEAYFAACLYNAKSALSILERSGGPIFRKVLPVAEESKLQRLRTLRNENAYQATTGAQALTKYVEEDRRNESPYYGTSYSYNAALFGERPVIEHENPDGKKVRAPVLRGTIGLYRKRHGRNVEAITMCREFIDLLRLLIDKMKAAESEQP